MRDRWCEAAWVELFRQGVERGWVGPKVTDVEDRLWIWKVVLLQIMAKVTWWERE